MLFQQFSGQPNILYYASDVFKAVGFCTEFSSALATVFLGLMKVRSWLYYCAIISDLLI